MTVGLGGEVHSQPTRRQRKKELQPLIQIEVMVQEKAKGQETSWEIVARIIGAEVGIVNDEQKKQQETEDGQITPRSGAGEARRSPAGAIRTHRQRTFSLAFSKDPFSGHRCKPIVPPRHLPVKLSRYPLVRR